jgi:hypothetical protein
MEPLVSFSNANSMKQLLRVKLAALLSLGMIWGWPGASAQDCPGVPWPATDALGRSLPLSSQVGPPKTNRFVGIFYFINHIGIPRSPDLDGPYDVAKILARDPGAATNADSPLWGENGMPHYWGEPLFGYYRGDDPWVLRRHARLLADAGVDVLIFDTTNRRTYPEIYTNLCEVFRNIRRSGGRTPQITFMVNTEAGRTAAEIYHELYQPNRYPELWFRWQGKPLLICDPALAGEELKEFFTLRAAHWPFTLTNTPYAWHWEATYPQPYGFTDDPQKPEQVNVAVAQNLSARDGTVANMNSGEARGRSFHAGRQNIAPGSIDRGDNFQEQWTRAFQLDPPFVMVTGWNEWLAGRWVRPENRLVFVDQYDEEYSRDIEPMKGGHGDNYYWQLVANVRRYKGVPALPAASAPKTIRITGGFDQWRRVAPEFAGAPGATQPRDFAGAGGLHYTNDTGRNNFIVLKTARDTTNLYFYARTAAPLSPATGSNWMWLFIDADQNAATGWAGYDYMVNRQPDSQGRFWLEKNLGGWRWEPVAVVAWRAAGNELQLAVPRTALGLPAGTTRTAIDFKWADNLRQPGEVMDFYSSGDVAPAGRFNFRYNAD